MARLTPLACKAARVLLGWGVRDLAREAGVGVSSVVRYERGDDVREETIQKIKAALEGARVEIINGAGTGARLLNATRPARQPKGAARKKS